MLLYSNNKFKDPKIEFIKGVAQLDLITLVQAANIINKILGSFDLPLVANIQVPNIFNELTKIDILSSKPLKVAATIDTKKMSWDYEAGKISQTQFIDYTGKKCYGVNTSSGWVAKFDEVEMIEYEMKLKSGKKLNMFVADAPDISDMNLYSLWSFVENLTCKYRVPRENKNYYTKIIIPALQIKYCRVMSEIEKMNSELLKISDGGTVLQKAYIALNETGVRVKAVTELKESSIFHREEPKIKIFGEKKPVLYWFAEKESNIPFAVFLTNSDAWPLSNATISFANKNFK